MRHRAAFWQGRFFAVLVCALLGCAQSAVAQTGDDLLQTYRQLLPRLQSNAYGQPLVIMSSETGQQVQGEVFAVLDFPMAVVGNSLERPAAWCDVMILHINTKQCIAAPGNMLAVYIGKKTPELVTDTTRIDFAFRKLHKSANALQVEMNAQRGPWGTSAYRIVLDAVALPDNRTFLHLTYAYQVNLAGRLAFNAYLGSIAKDKVGFSTREQDSGNGGAAPLVGGVRGLVERNTVRYYLAIDAYLRSLALAPDQQVESRLQSWYRHTERYPRQLHDMERDVYLEMKRAEIARQRVVAE